ncbi:MAG TPA: hypothetical protein VGP47_02175 [Parachlamydiaceae bacterium]|nr:hypothetical protein [Parachlamydiaceae bacterium]
MDIPLVTDVDNKISKHIDQSKKTEGVFRGRAVNARTKCNSNKKKPNLLLFSCNFGSGHKMASQGIKECLPDYNVKIVDIYDGPLRSFNIFEHLSPSLSNENIVNYLANKQFNRFISFMGNIGAKIFNLSRNRNENSIKEYLLKNKPDLLVSCIPLVNSILNNVAKELNIPLLVVTTDIDLTNFCKGFEDKDITVDKRKLQITVPYSAQNWKYKFGKEYSEKLEKSFHYSFGFPTRKAFTEKIDEQSLDLIRKEYGITSDENVILIIMGGNSSQAAEDYAKLLLEMTDTEIKKIIGNDNHRNKIHLVCLCGDTKNEENQKLLETLNKFNESYEKKNNLVRIHGCPSTNKVAELVSLPELCTVISKPGGSTVNEMIKKKIPMIYHVSETLLDWEKGNMEYGESRDFGMQFQTSGEINPTQKSKFAKVLNHTMELHKKMKTDPEYVPEAENDFSENLRATVKEMLKSNSSKN